MFDNQCYATTPSSSNGNSDQEPGNGYGGRRHQHHQHQQTNTPTPGSPTSRLLLEYEMHLRNTLAKGMDAESYSLHTFEALLSQSMENLGNQRSLTNVKFEKKDLTKISKLTLLFQKTNHFFF
jgi:T-lymphoma invasion and metastasis-inducing protein 1